MYCIPIIESVNMFGQLVVKFSSLLKDPTIEVIDEATRERVLNANKNVTIDLSESDESEIDQLNHFVKSKDAITIELISASIDTGGIST